MEKFFTRILVILMCVSFVGCTTTNALTNMQPSAIQQNVKVGDKVVVLTTDANTQTFEVTEVTETYIAGADIKIDYSDIKSLEKKEINKGKTAAAVGGTALVVWVIIGIIGGYMFGKAMDEQFGN